MRFTFAGNEYEGRKGETLAAALVRNGVLDGFRSVYLDRPRGVFSAGEEEPNALVQIGAEPMVRATQVELEAGLSAEPLAGKGRLVTPRDHTRYDMFHAHCDLLVVGGGASGVAAARAGTGRTILVHSGPRCGLVSGGDLRVLTRTTAVGLYDGNYAVAVERGRRLWHIRAKRVVLATGAIERPLVFPNNDRPGVMLAGAARRYELGGARVVVFTNNDTALGLPGTTVVDARAGRLVVDTLGEERLDGVVLDDGSRIDCDVLAVSGGWSPAVHLWTQRGGRLRFDERTAAFVPDGELPGVEVHGKAAGTCLPDVLPLWLVPGDEDVSFVDLERDSTVADLRRAVGAGLRSVEHVKRFTTVGTGSDQGKTAGVNAIGVAAELLGVSPGELGTTTFRPPYVPVSFALLAGRNRGELFDPVRVTPIHAWHFARGAVFENVGQWKRPRYYPRAGEGMEAAVLRECAAAREGVAVMDATTLGKIDVQGPDAVELLNRLYTNAYETLAVGRCRYGVLCKPDGMVLDDGVVMRVGEERFVCTTTTGNAAPVLAWMEEWLQTEWPELRVWLTSVTEQWATVAVVGPDARELLARLTEIPLDAESFPFMAIREGTVAGIPARVCRISFSGELAYEVNVDGRRGLALWEAVMAAGEVTPYGTETMHVLRAEKGYPIIGQETDGTVTPQDLGMDWIVSKQKPDFLGKRSFSRADTSRADRKHLVGLLPADQDEVMPEGAQLVADANHHVPAPMDPVPMLGHVTSSYRSAALGRTFALALVENGRERIGQTVYAPLPGRTIAAEIVDSVLYDKEGARRDGRSD
jgi:sarcosine oxidase, subunit alpha